MIVQRPASRVRMATRRRSQPGPGRRFGPRLVFQLCMFMHPALEKVVTLR